MVELVLGDLCACALLSSSASLALAGEEDGEDPMGEEAVRGAPAPRRAAARTAAEEARGTAPEAAAPPLLAAAAAATAAKPPPLVGVPCGDGSGV